MGRQIKCATEWEFNYNELARMIRNKMQSDGLSMRETSSQCGLEDSHIYRIFKGEYLPTMHTICAICSWLKVNPAMLFYKKKF